MTGLPRNTRLVGRILLIMHAAAACALSASAELRMMNRQSDVPVENVWLRIFWIIAAK